MRSRVAFVDAGKRAVRVEEIDREDIVGPVDWGLYCHLELYESYKYDVYDEHNVLCLGMGRLAGGVLPGTHRLIGCFRSPMTKGFFVSTMGGAAYALRFLGVDFVTIEGKSEKPLVVALRGTKEGVSYEFIELEPEELLKIYQGYEGEEGVFALERYALERVKHLYKAKDGYCTFRILVVGPAAMNTNIAGIFSSVIKKDGTIDVGAEDWMARGGPGSVLYRAHGIVALAIGGDHDWRRFEGELDLKDIKKVDAFFREKLGKGFSETVVGATKKYRETGTFGGNYPTLKDRTLMFNWQQIYLDYDTRMKLFKEFVADRFLKHFQERVLALKPKTFKTCGEPCPAVCKKVYADKYKLDYEPSSACGTQLGIFDLEIYSKVLHTVDAMGFDAIEYGNTLAWVFEALHRGLLKPEDFGIDKVPSFDPLKYRAEDAALNAEIAIEITKKIAYGEGEIAKIIGEGIRPAAKKLNEKFRDRVEKVGLRFEDIAVYVPFGEDGWMTPCQYWDPAFLVPLPFQGTFMTKYHAPFSEPEAFAELCFGRLVHELYSENNGVCRFHRGWFEKLAEALLKAAYGIDIKLEEHTKALIKRVLEYDIKAGCRPRFWEGKRQIDLLAAFVKDEAFKGNETAKAWAPKFESAPADAAREYWERFLRKLHELTGVEW